LNLWNERNKRFFRGQILQSTSISALALKGHPERNAPAKISEEEMEGLQEISKQILQFCLLSSGREEIY